MAVWPPGGTGKYGGEVVGGGAEGGGRPPSGKSISATSANRPMHQVHIQGGWPAPRRDEGSTKPPSPSPEGEQQRK